MAYRKQLQNKNKIIIKVGTSSLTHSNGKLNLMRMEKLVRVIVDIHNSGKEVLLVSSGAIATGAAKMGLDKKPDDKIKKLALAAIGQAELIKIYDKFFQEYNKTVAQILITKDGIENSIRRKNAKNTINELLRMGIIPIINENDTISTHEIEFGDNDTLSAVVSSLINADLSQDLESYIYDNKSAFGTGGMASKLIAARHCIEHNIDMVIINGSDPAIIFDVLSGKDVGTHFVSQTAIKCE
jgi:glutamate 5-kinase